MDEPITDIAEQYTYGEEVTIACKAEGNPAPQFSWTKDDQSLAGGSTHTFSRIQYSDAGSYTCTAKNAAKELTSSDDITVDGECLVTIVQKEATASQTPNAAALMLACEVQGPECASKSQTNNILLYNLTCGANDKLLFSHLVIRRRTRIGRSRKLNL